MKVLVSGGNGLLGNCMTRVFREAGHEVDSFGHSALKAGMKALDITNSTEVLETVCNGSYDILINCAADRDPESCLSDPAKAYMLNAVSVEHLAAAANSCGAKLCHISTDYVFDGTKPPYNESDSPNPVNTYGRSKLAGEFAAKEARAHLILRIPALYRTDLSDPKNVVTNFAKAMRANSRLTMDAECVRYYTLADDVAQAAEFLLSKGVEGIVHLTGEEQTTKADFCRMIAGALKIESCEIIDGPTPPSGDRRPENSHLNCDYYKSLGGKPFVTVSEAMKKLF